MDKKKFEKISVKLHRNTETRVVITPKHISSNDLRHFLNSKKVMPESALPSSHHNPSQSTFQKPKWPFAWSEQNINAKTNDEICSNTSLHSPFKLSENNRLLIENYEYKWQNDENFSKIEGEDSVSGLFPPNKINIVSKSRDRIFSPQVGNFERRLITPKSHQGQRIDQLRPITSRKRFILPPSDKKKVKLEDLLQPKADLIRRTITVQGSLFIPNEESDEGMDSKSTNLGDFLNIHRDETSYEEFENVAADGGHVSTLRREDKCVEEFEDVAAEQKYSSLMHRDVTSDEEADDVATIAHHACDEKFVNMAIRRTFLPKPVKTTSKDYAAPANKRKLSLSLRVTATNNKFDSATPLKNTSSGGITRKRYISDNESESPNSENQSRYSPLFRKNAQPYKSGEEYALSYDSSAIDQTMRDETDEDSASPLSHLSPDIRTSPSSNRNTPLERDDDVRNASICRSERTRHRHQPYQKTSSRNYRREKEESISQFSPRKKVHPGINREKYSSGGLSRKSSSTDENIRSVSYGKKDSSRELSPRSSTSDETLRSGLYREKDSSREHFRRSLTIYADKKCDYESNRRNYSSSGRERSSLTKRPDVKRENRSPHRRRDGKMIWKNGSPRNRDDLTPKKKHKMGNIRHPLKSPSAQPIRGIRGGTPNNKENNSKNRGVGCEKPKQERLRKRSFAESASTSKNSEKSGQFSRRPRIVQHHETTFRRHSGERKVTGGPKSLKKFSGGGLQNYGDDFHRKKERQNHPPPLMSLKVPSFGKKKLIPSLMSLKVPSVRKK